MAKALQAFVCHNDAYEILLAMNFLMLERTRDSVLRGPITILPFTDIPATASGFVVLANLGQSWEREA